MMPSRIRLKAINVTEHNIPLARMCQAIASVLEFALENLVSEKERIDAHEQNDEGGNRSQRTD